MDEFDPPIYFQRVCPREKRQFDGCTLHFTHRQGLSARALAGIDAMRARLPAGDYRSSLHVRYHHPRVERQSSHHVALGQSGVRVTIARADIRTSTRIRRVMVLQQMSRRVQIAVRHVLSSPAMRASHAGTMPLAWLLPSPSSSPGPSLAFTPPVHPSLLPLSWQPWQP